ncbi:MAG: carbohydrate ABC transporter permease, partial [Alphaproteobacteria bacterium]|nr:carbohydrate ABC transporter permease [Alphaproteobacteria bacterium]
MLIWGFIALWLVVAAFPFLWTLWGSFKMEADFFSKADWVNALTAPRTIAEHGTAFIGEGYHKRYGQ